MGHSRADKAQTHQRLVETASSRFREKGLDGISLADLMKELGLTHGGFYKHFPSRDALVSEAIDQAYQASGNSLAGFIDNDGHLDLPRYVDMYLSRQHRDHPGAGCAISTLSGDIARRGEDMRESYRQQMDRIFERIGAAFPGDKASQRKQAIELMTRMYGALMVARAAGSGELSDEVLATVREQIRASLPGAG
ncbi:TetR/AcrR family transcriptional regulator [Dyella sp.]|uniref:TetR/AcrR family transcriptional regulator n=1 Tax=Dyella sp. TaxID=1869338 RepID=UPI002ED4980F